MALIDLKNFLNKNSGLDDIGETLKFFPEALKETVETRKWLPEPIRGFAESFTPKTPEEAKEKGLVSLPKI